MWDRYSFFDLRRAYSIAAARAPGRSLVSFITSGVLEELHLHGRVCRSVGVNALMNRNQRHVVILTFLLATAWG